jgi:hypothetical protein
LDWIQVALGFLLIVNTMPFLGGMAALGFRDAYRETRWQSFRVGYLLGMGIQATIVVCVGALALGTWLISGSW